MLFKRSYGISILAITVTGAALYGPGQLIPQYVQQVLGYTATDAGLALTLGGVVTIFVMPFAGVLTNHVQPRYLIMVGLLSQVAGLMFFTNINTDIGFNWVALARTTIAAGLPLLFIPINTVALNDIPPDRIPEAAAQLNLARNVGGSIAIAGVQAILEQRSQFHQSRIVETLNTGNVAFQSFLTAAQRTVGGQGALAEIYQLVRLQAQTLAFIDVFYVVALCVAVTVPLMLLLEKVEPGQAQAG